MKTILLAILTILMTATPQNSMIVTENNSKESFYLLNEFELLLNEKQIIFSDIYNNGTLFAIVLTNAPTYFQKPEQSLDQSNCFLLHIGRYNDTDEIWEMMVNQPIQIGNDYTAHIEVEPADDSFCFKVDENLSYILYFLDNQFILKQ